MPTVNVTVLSAHNLVAKDVTGTSDPYCIIKCGNAKHRTTTKKLTTNPSWFESFSCTVMDPMRETITFDLYDKDFLTKDDPLGSAVVQLNTLRRGVPERMSLNLMGARTGVLMVELTAIDFGQAMMMGQPMMGQPMMQPMMQQPMMQQPMMQPMMQQPMVHPTMMQQPMMQQPMMGQPMMTQSTTYTSGYPNQPNYGVPPQMGYPPYGGGYY